jgi:hypothetical protein
MANTLRFKRGLASGIPTGVAGEPLFTTDTFDLYIGNGTTNTRFQKYIASGTTSQYLRGDGTLATFPSLTGFVPYTGATANVDLGVYTILAQNATIASSGSGNTATITHSSGSGIALNITKGGNGEGLYINKTSGSGNAATIIGTLNATSLVKSGGTSTQYLMADGTTSTLTNPITGTGTTNYLPKFTGATTLGNSQIFDNGTSVGIGTTTVTGYKLSIYQGLSAAVSTPNGLAFRSDVTGTLGLTLHQGIIWNDFSGNDLARILPVVDNTSSSAATHIRFYTHNGTSAAERMRLTALGNLHIGTFSSDSGEKLQVTGTMKVTGASSFGSTITASGDIKSATTTNASLTATTSSTTGYSYLDLVNTGTSGKNYQIGVGGNSAAANYANSLYFDLSGVANLMMLTSSGNLGIGTTSPESRLMINGDWADMTGTITYSTNTKGIILNQGGGGGQGMGIWFRQTGLTAGIGSTRVSDGNWATDLRFYTHPSSTTNQNTLFERMRINSEGNVLVGSTSDSGELLQVNGTAKITGAVSLGSSLSTGASITSGDSVLLSGELYYGGIASNRKARAYTTGSEGAATLNYSFWNGSTWVVKSTLDYNGAATFSSSVTANAGYIAGTGALASDVSMLFKTDTGDFSLINQRASHSFGIYDNLNTRYNLNFSSTGEATFSSSVTAASATITGNLTVDSSTLFVDSTANEVGIGTNAPNSSLHVVGSITKSIIAKTANYTATVSDYTILCDTTGGGFTITLPASSGITGRIYVIKKTNASSGVGNVTIDGNGSETIDGAATIALQCKSSVMLQCDGSNWHILSLYSDTSCI